MSTPNGIETLADHFEFFDYSRVTDGAGSVRWKSVPSGDYVLRIEQAGYWVDHLPVTVGGTDMELFLELRKLGRFELRVSNQNGLPVNGVRVDLRHLDLGADLLDLAAENRVGLPDAGMSTHGRGRFEIKNLPEGRNRWSILLADGDTMSGVVLVEGGALARAAAVLP